MAPEKVAACHKAQGVFSAEEEINPCLIIMIVMCILIVGMGAEIGCFPGQDHFSVQVQCIEIRTVSVRIIGEKVEEFLAVI